MRVLVILEEIPDTDTMIPQNARTETVREEWLVRRLDDAAHAAIAFALRLRGAVTAGRLTALTIGPRSAESVLRPALSLGADEAFRIWEPELSDIGDAGRSLLYAAAAQALGCDLILLGATGRQGEESLVAALTAEEIGIPFVLGVEAAALSDTGDLIVSRTLEAGFAEELAVTPPAVLSARGVTGQAPGNATASVEDLLAAEAAVIPVLDLAELGVPTQTLRAREGRLSLGPLRPPHPALLPAAAPDSCLPAFDRIQTLVCGSVKSREGRLIRGTSSELADELFARLRDRAWLSTPAVR